MNKQPGNLSEFLLLQDVHGPVMRLRTGGASCYRSIVEVTGTYFNLLDEEKQQELYEQYHRLFLSLDFPLQFIARVTPLDIEDYVRFVKPKETGESWQVLARDHAKFLRALVKQRGLLGRRFYVVIGAEQRASGQVHLGKREQEEMSYAEAAQVLRLRSETITYHLKGLGLGCELVTDKRLADFYTGFAVGTSMLPQTLLVERDHLCIEDQSGALCYVRVQQLSRLPRTVSFGWLKALVECDETFDLVHHLMPRTSEQMLVYLRRQQTHATASTLQASKTGRNAPAVVTLARSDLTPLIEEVTAGEQTMLDSSLSLLIRAGSLEELDQKTRRINQRVSLTFTRRPKTQLFEQASSFRSCLPGSLASRDPLLLPSSAVTTMIPFFDHFVFKPSETAILEGMTPHNEPIILDWWSDLPNANRLILGPSGWGKSYKAKLDILHLYYMYKNKADREHREDGFQILIVDPERETDRSPGFSLVERLGGQSIRFSPGSQHRLNPLDLPVIKEGDTKEDVLANHIQKLHRVLDCMLAFNVEDQSNTLTSQEKSLLDAALYECYRRAGIEAARSTHARPAPLLSDLLEVLQDEVCGPDRTELCNRLRRYTHGSLSGLFSGPTNIDLSNTLVQFDVRDLESELRPTGLMLISNYIWNIAFAEPIPRFLFIDELATIGRYRAGRDFLEELFQRSRKHYLSVTGITQHPGHLSESIIANCASHILLHQNEATLPKVTELFRLSGREVQHVRGFDKGEALLLANGKRMSVRFLGSPMEDKLITTNRRQIEAIEAKKS